MSTPEYPDTAPEFLHDDTPETNTLEVAMDAADLSPLAKLPKYAEHARKLERERNRMRRRLDTDRSHFHRQLEAIRNLLEELDRP